MMNGQTAGFFDTTQTPFVTSFAPGAAGLDSPLTERLQRFAARELAGAHGVKASDSVSGGGGGRCRRPHTRQTQDPGRASKPGWRRRRPVRPAGQTRALPSCANCTHGNPRPKRVRGIKRRKALVTRGRRGGAGRQVVGGAIVLRAGPPAEPLPPSATSFLSRARALPDTAKKPSRSAAKHNSTGRPNPDGCALAPRFDFRLPTSGL